MKSILLFTLHLCISLCIVPVYAQDSLISHQSARVEIGLGSGMVGDGGGLAGRIAFSYLHSNWGGVVRLSANDGREGKKSGWFGPPKEKFYDTGLLVSYIPIQTKYWQVVTSFGVGFLYGERLTNTETDLEEFDSITGFAWEVGFASAGSTFGWSLSIMGNFNSESNMLAFLLSVTFGYQN